MTAKQTCTSDWKEMRRFRVPELKNEGCTNEEVAEALGVTKGTVTKWMKAAREFGERALPARPRKGSPPELTPEELAALPELLRLGATEYGFGEDLWTCERVAQVIDWEFGVKYHKRHVARLLKALNWTPQKPVVRDLRRDEGEIERWRKEVWPELKKRRGAKTT
jgi:transposase